MAYGYEFQNRENDTLYKGRDLEFVIDDENDLGEVYLDGNLIFQQTEVYSDQDLQRSFKDAFETVQSEDGTLDRDSFDTDEIGMDKEPVFVSDDEIDVDDELEAIGEDDDIDYDDPGLQEGMYTAGGEYATVDGREFIGDYHLHPKYGAMIGKFHSDRPHGRLVELDITDVQAIRDMGRDPFTAIDYTTDMDEEEFGDLDDGNY